MTPPILMREADARAYLGGADPHKLVAPIRLGARKWFSRLALDRAVAERAGLADTTPRGSSEDAYDAWKAHSA
jgi:hypothetical protein